MADIDNETLRNLARQLTEPQRLQDAAGLAGSGLQLPLVTLRARAARRELRRIEAREGAKSPGAVAQAEVVGALARRQAQVAETFARRAAEPPEIGKGEAGLSGRITRDCQPVAGLGLLALNAQNEPLRQTCTGRDGRYAIGIPAGTDIRIELRDDGKPVFADKEGFAFPSGYRATRDIEIGEGDPICNPTEAATGDALQMPGLVGLEARAALRSLEALGLKLGEMSETPSDRPGIVLAQKPRAGALVTRGTAAALQVGARDDRPAAVAGDLAGEKLGDGLRRMAETNVAPASVVLVRGKVETAMIRESRATEAGDAIHLSVTVAEGEEAKLAVAAAVLAAAPEGKGLEIDTPEAAEKWLAGAGIATLGDLSVAAGEDDATLRKRLALEPRSSVAAQRRALLALATRIRDA